MKPTNEEIKRKAVQCKVADMFENDVSEYIDFAFYLLENKIESENIFILAGLSADEKDDARKYFEIVVSELNIQTDADNADFIYVCYLNEKIYEGKRDAQTALSKLSRLYISENKELFSDFYDLLILIEDYFYLGNIEPIKNMNEYIKRFFEFFIKFYYMELPKDFYKQAYCKFCGKRVIPAKKSFFGKTKYIQFCPNCRKKNVKDWAYCKYNSGKELYLKEIGGQ